MGIDEDSSWMRHALIQARRAAELGEVPVGAVCVKDGQCIAESFNAPIGRCDPTAHAEINALRGAAQAVGNYRLTGVSLYVTLQPCVMCIGALVHARIDRVIYGAHDEKTSSATAFLINQQPDWANHQPIWVGGILADECRGLLQDFFVSRR